MYQFNSQFVYGCLIPVLKKVTKDLHEGQKNLYLKKIALGAATPDTKSAFISDYLSNDETVSHFVGTEEPAATEFADQFYNSFSKLIAAQTYLIGEQAVNNISPEADGNIKHDQENNLYRFAYYIVHDFEASRILKIKGVSLTSDERTALAEGRLRLIRLADGTEQVVSEATLAQAAQTGAGQMQVTPYVEFGLGQKMIGNPNPAFALESEVKSLMQTAGVDDIIKLQVTDQSATIAELATDFDASTIATAEIAMQLNGLEIVEPLTAILDANGKSTGRYKGKVKDVNGKVLDVIVDVTDDPSDTTKKPKFIFNFEDDENPGKIQLILAADDLSKFEERAANGTPIRRRPAEEVAHIAGIKVFRKPEHVEMPETGHPNTFQAGLQQEQPDYIPETTDNGLRFPLPHPAPVRQLKSARVGTYIPKFKPVSIPQRKAATEATARYNPASQNAAPQKTEQPTYSTQVQRQSQPQAQRPAPQRKKSKSWIAALAGGSAFAGGIGAAGIGAWLANTDQTSQTVSMLIKVISKHWIV